MIAEPEIAVRARISGRVQGVCYRAWTVEQASRLGLKGFVRNRHDGSVEALFKGPAEQVDTMLALCWQGPPRATVTAVASEPAQGMVPDRFEQKPSV
ncbi:MAG: acylphosphatase [Sphingomonadales bacterium]